MKKNICLFGLVAMLSMLSVVLVTNDTSNSSELELAEVELMAEGEQIPYFYRQKMGSWNFATYEYWCINSETGDKTMGDYCGSGFGGCIWDDRCH